VELLLEPLNVDLVTVENGREAIDVCRRSRFDIVLMDMQMPVMDGLAATRAIRVWEHEQGLDRTPVAMLTANTYERHRQEAREAGVDAFLAKPITGETLYDVIGQLTDAPEDQPA